MVATLLDEGLREFRRQGGEGWALAWGLAAELCDRFYASHGLMPFVIIREGLGYCGIGFGPVQCRVHGETGRSVDGLIGRLTMRGNVENWISGGPGDHGLNLVDRALEGETADALLSDTIRHLGWLAIPPAAHGSCRHKRRGASFVLVFKVVAALAVRHDRCLRVRNHPAVMPRAVLEMSPSSLKPDGPGLFHLQTNDGELVLTGDGQALIPQRTSLWNGYMAGQSFEGLVAWAERCLGLTRRR